jgi:hypothetical protein
VHEGFYWNCIRRDRTQGDLLKPRGLFLGEGWVELLQEENGKAGDVCHTDRLFGHL